MFASVQNALFDFQSRMRIYNMVIPFFMKEFDRKHNPNTSMRKLSPIDPDIEQSLDGKVCVITGGSRGLGVHVVKTLLSKGCHVITASSAKSDSEINKRYEEIMRQVPDSKGKLEIWRMDLQSMDSVMQFAERFTNSNLKLDYFIANAGIMLKPYKKTVDNIESHYAVNYLSHCLLIFYLLPILVETGRKSKTESRIILVSSCAHLAAEMNFHDLQLTQQYSRYFAYAQSKLAEIMFTYKLSRWLNQKSDWGRMVKVHALHPGLCNTELFNVIDIVRYFPQIAEKIAFRTAEEGAETIIYATLSSQLNGMSGLFLEDSAISHSSDHSQDKSAQETLWRITWKSLKMWTYGRTIDDI